VGFFDIFKKKKAVEPPPASGAGAGTGAGAGEEEEEVEAPVTAVVVLRAGMASPDDAYCKEILGTHFPEALERDLPVTPLSQPRWFKSEHLQSGLRLLARAMAADTQTDPGAATWILCSGPDGAPAAIVLLRP